MLALDIGLYGDYNRCNCETRLFSNSFLLQTSGNILTCDASFFLPGLWTLVKKKKREKRNATSSNAYACHVTGSKFTESRKAKD